MKIISWNVNGIRSIIQKGFFEFMESQNPELLCIQETKAHPDQLEDSVQSPLGWKVFWSAAQRPGYSGTATFCRHSPLRVDHGFGVQKFDAEGRMVVTQYPKFTLYNVYFPNGGASQERHLFKQEFLKRFGAHLFKKIKSGENIILVGDYNIAYLDIDVYDPKALSTESGFLPEERNWMREFLDNGFVDGFRYYHPTEKHRYTWWSYYQNARMGNRGWRIDHICVSRGLEKHIKSVEILDQQLGSDHCPVVMEIDL